MYIYTYVYTYIIKHKYPIRSNEYNLHFITNQQGTTLMDRFSFWEKTIKACSSSSFPSRSSEPRPLGGCWIYWDWDVLFLWWSSSPKIHAGLPSGTKPHATRWKFHDWYLLEESPVLQLRKLRPRGNPVHVEAPWRSLPGRSHPPKHRNKYYDYEPKHNFERLQYLEVDKY